MELGSIRDHRAYAQGKMISFVSINKSFARFTITPTDIDFAVEQQGHFLFGEYKHKLFGKEASDGQLKTYMHLVGAMRGRAVFFFAEHSTPVEQDIDGGLAIVTSFICFQQQWKFDDKDRTLLVSGDHVYHRRMERQITVKEFAEGWSKTVEPKRMDDVLLTKAGIEKEDDSFS